MKQDRPIENAVDEALNSLDGLNKASPGPWFVGRVMARWER